MNTAGSSSFMAVISSELSAANLSERLRAVSSGDPVFDLLCISLAVSGLALILACGAILRNRGTTQSDSVDGRLVAIETLLADLKNIRTNSSVELRSNLEYIKIELTSLRSELGDLSDQISILEKVVRMTPSLQSQRDSAPGRRPTI